MQRPAFEVRDVALSYSIRRRFRTVKTKKVFENLNLEVYEGERIGLTGRNGVGKSSLLRVLAGTLQPDRGRIINRCQHTALLTMNFGIEPMLSGRMNAVLHALYLGYTRETVRRKFDDIVSFAGLEDVIDDPYFTYSTGMRARLSFSVVYHLQADLLLIDELLGVGDTEFRRKSKDAMLTKMKRSTTVIVSHDKKILRSLCDRLYVLRPSGLELLAREQ